MHSLSLLFFTIIAVVALTTTPTAVDAQNTTTTTAPTTVTAPMPTERPAEEYLLVLSGTKDQWKSLLDNNKTKLAEALKLDLAGRFFTSEGFIRILEMIAGSLKVTFSVLPGLDGTQINDGAFFDSTGDGSWLKSTGAVFKTVSSSSSIDVTSTGYANASRTRPPKHVVLSDGGAGAVAAGGAVLFVICALVLWAWRWHAKEKDDMVITKIEEEGEFGANEPTVGGGEEDDDDVEELRHHSGVFSDRRMGRRSVPVTPRE